MAADAAIFHGVAGLDLMLFSRTQGSMMQRRFLGMWFFSFLLLAGCETTQPRQFAPPADYVPLEGLRIESRLPVVEVTSSNLAEEALKCVPTLHTTSKSIQQLAGKLPLAAGTTTVLGHASSANQFIVRGTSSACLRRSEARHVILAADALLDTVNPVGVSPDVQDDWYKQIALKLAQSGTVKVAYAYSSGAASAATYWLGMGQHDGGTLFYTYEFKKAGAWEPSAYGLVFRDRNLASISETKRGGVGRKSDFFPFRR